MEVNLTTNQWYQSLINDCEGIISESLFISRWTLVQGYHMLGSRILEDSEKFGEIPIHEIGAKVSLSLGKSTRTVQRAVQFAKEYPVLDDVPGGKALTWHKVCNNLLPSGKAEFKDPSYIRYVMNLDQKPKLQIYSALYKEFKGRNPDKLLDS
jgi:hypothetical protein